MDTSREIIPGLVVRIHQDAIDEGLVKIENEYSIPLNLEKVVNPDEEELVLSSEAVGELMKYRTRIERVGKVGGGYYKVDGRDESKIIPYDGGVAGARDEAYSKALVAALQEERNEADA